MTDPVVTPIPTPHVEPTKPPVAKKSMDDLSRAAALLRIVHDAATIGPGLGNITTEAMAELTALNDEAGVRLAKAKAEADKKAAADLAKATAVEAARLKAEDDHAKVQQKAQVDADLKAKAAAAAQFKVASPTSPPTPTILTSPVVEPSPGPVPAATLLDSEKRV
jgi:hypothetical protein